MPSVTLEGARSLQQSSSTDLLEARETASLADPRLAPRKADSGTSGAADKGQANSRVVIGVDSEPDSESPKSKQLLLTALITGVAISLHNFPEGLATFVATARASHTLLNCMTLLRLAHSVTIDVDSDDNLDNADDANGAGPFGGSTPSSGHCHPQHPRGRLRSRPNLLCNT